MTFHALLWVLLAGAAVLVVIAWRSVRVAWQEVKSAWFDFRLALVRFRDSLDDDEEAR